MNAPDTIFHRGLFTTLDRSNPDRKQRSADQGWRLSRSAGATARS